MIHSKSSWSLLSHHGHVLLQVASSPELRVTELASRLGLAERSIRTVLATLRTSSCLDVERQGRNNRYVVDLDFRLQHPLEQHYALRKIVSELAPFAIDGTPG